MAPNEVRIYRFEDVEVGQTEELAVTITREMVDAFASVTGDINPLHMSEAFAKSRGHAGRVAHGLLVASLFSTIAGTMLPGRDCLIHNVRFDFTRPVLAGERVRLEATVVQTVQALRVVQLELTAFGEDGAPRVRGRMQAQFVL
jgi:3-hydroxybutyryl-CoA dehydratase